MIDNITRSGCGPGEALECPTPNERLLERVTAYTVIAIDPGANGAIVEYRPNDSPGLQVSVHKMPDTPKDIYTLLASIQNSSDECVCVIEKVGGYVKGNAVHCAVTFARHCGHLEMALIALGIPIVEEVAPKVWQKPLGPFPLVPKRKDYESDKAHKAAVDRVKGERKNIIKSKMQKRYPSINVTLWNADALGIATWYMD